eukprot:NODE_1801_length_543_cov_403.578947_g1458_i0.p1 GENE.NODE_1801_length_543_cov_403.578947_g1458_i0~~NODE_1801_length_543_cov_403.578947_g1458_i0.p1  ORF type:complete len:159 (+),score=44.45 NODE_1801_length_543_cov_403.578947_g1458_i0:29-478(+)
MGCKDNISTELRDELLRNIRERLKSQPFRVRCDVEVQCFGNEGIDAVKEALLAGKAVGSEEVPLTITLLAPPTYVMRATCLDKDEGLGKLNEALERIKEVIDSKAGGSMKIQEKKGPRVVSDHDQDRSAAAQPEEEQEEDEESEKSDDD